MFLSLYEGPWGFYQKKIYSCLWARCMCEYNGCVLVCVHLPTPACACRIQRKKLSVSCNSSLFILLREAFSLCMELHCSLATPKILLTLFPPKKKVRVVETTILCEIPGSLHGFWDPKSSLYATHSQNEGQDFQRFGPFSQSNKGPLKNLKNTRVVCFQAKWYALSDSGPHDCKAIQSLQIIAWTSISRKLKEFGYCWCSFGVCLVSFIGLKYIDLC